MAKVQKNKILILLKLVIGIGLIIYLFRKVDIDEFSQRMGSINFYWLFVMFLLPHINILLCTLKWQWLLKALKVPSNLLRLFWLYLLGTFFANFFPSALGGDAVRAFRLTKDKKEVSSVIAATFTERLTGVSALVTCSFIPLLDAKTGELFPAIKLVVALVMVCYIILILTIFKGEKLLLFIEGFSRSQRFLKLTSVLKNSQQKLLMFKNYMPVVFMAYLVSIAFYGIAVITVQTAALALNINIDISAIVVVVPLVLLVALLPLSIGGLGINEGGYVFFFTLFGLSGADALSIALLLRLRIIFTSILGGFVFMFLNDERPTETISERTLSL